MNDALDVAVTKLAAWLARHSHGYHDEPPTKSEWGGIADQMRNAAVMMRDLLDRLDAVTGERDALLSEKWCQCVDPMRWVHARWVGDETPECQRCKKLVPVRPVQPARKLKQGLPIVTPEMMSEMIRSSLEKK